MKNINPKNEIPTVYLSNSELGWSLIKDGMPLCAHTSKENAEKLATQFKLVPNQKPTLEKTNMKTEIKPHNENSRAAIISKYSGPTNSRGSRIIVKSQRSRRSYPYPYELSGADCHKWAVSQYLSEILNEDRKEYGELATGWGTLADFSFGQIPSGEYVFVSNK